MSKDWNVSGLTSETVFTNNLCLIGGNVTVFDSTQTTTEYARVDTDEMKGYLTLK